MHTKLATKRSIVHIVFRIQLYPQYSNIYILADTHTETYIRTDDLRHYKGDWSGSHALDDLQGQRDKLLQPQATSMAAFGVRLTLRRPGASDAPCRFESSYSIIPSAFMSACTRRGFDSGTNRSLEPRSSKTFTAKTLQPQSCTHPKFPLAL